MIVLGIESSCDETACGIVDGDGRVLANELYSQIPEHAPFGGVVPEVAARAHLEKVGPIVRAALDKAGIPLQDVDVVAYTRGPGLMGPVLVGASFARGLAAALGKPAAGINHLEGHIAAARLSHPDLEPPFLALTVSGGHTQIDRALPGFRFETLGQTRDDAAGEAFDKCGKLLGLGYPAGPYVSREAKNGDRSAFRFPRALRGVDTLDFSFSGLKSAVLRLVESRPAEELLARRADVCAGLEEAIVDMLTERALQAGQATGIKTLAVCGGVSANPRLREKLPAELEKRGMKALFPDLRYCTDNGAMIAGAALFRLKSQCLVFEHLPVSPGLELGEFLQ